MKRRIEKLICNILDTHYAPEYFLNNKEYLIYENSYLFKYLNYIFRNTNKDLN